MPLFYIQDNDRPGYVKAKNYEEAVNKWRNAVSKENDDCDIDPPKGAQFLADDFEIILETDWVEPLP